MNNIHPYLIPAFDVYQINKQLTEFKTPDAIKHQVAKHYAKDPIIQALFGELTTKNMIELICSKTRKKEIIEPRYATIYFLKDILKPSLKTIGVFVGLRDHSTVIHALRTYENDCETDRQRFNNHVELCSIFKIPNKLNFFK